MILRKPYAFFIKYFKLIHILISVLIGYLIYKTNILLNFFSSYLESTVSVIGQKLILNYFSNILFIIPIIVIALSLLILTILFRKNKPYKFYIINTFVFIAIFVLFVYSSSVLTSMENNILNIKVVKLTHDLLVLTIMSETITFLFFLTRGLGLNFKKFDFSSDLNKLSISDADKEEIEINITFDVNEKRRNLRKNIRNLKYLYLENKFKIILVMISLLIFISFIIYYFGFYKKTNIKEGVVINSNGINYVVNSSYIIKEKEKNILVLDIDLSSYLEDKIVYLKDMVIDIENYKITNTLKYCDSLTDIGACYKQDKLNDTFKSYILVYEIPEIYINSKIIFEYISTIESTKVDLNPSSMMENKNEHVYNLGDKIIFEEKALNNIDFTIFSMELQKKYKIQYNYCTPKNTCVESYEILVPSLDTNFDKSILKLNLEYSSANENYNSFYSLMSKYSYIEYFINGQSYKQRDLFEEINSLKVFDKNIVYIGVDSNIMNSEKINLVFEFRNNKYIYKIKGD